MRLKTNPTIRDSKVVRLQRHPKLANIYVARAQHRQCTARSPPSFTYAKVPASALSCGALRRRELHAEVFVLVLSATFRNNRVHRSSPWCLTLYRNSTTASFSAIPCPLKCFLTAFASWSLLCRLLFLSLAIVGEKCPMPGRDRISWLYSLL